MVRKPIFSLNFNGFSQFGDSTVFIGGSTSFSICWKEYGISFAMDSDSAQGVVKSPDFAWSKTFLDTNIIVNWEDLPCTELNLYKITENGEEQFASLDISYTTDVLQWEGYKAYIRDKRGIFIAEQFDLIDDYASGVRVDALWERIDKKFDELEDLYTNGKIRNDEYNGFYSRLMWLKYRIAVENLASQTISQELRAKFFDILIEYLK